MNTKNDESKDIYIEEVKHYLLRMTSSERVQLLIDRYFELENPGEKTRELFIDWLMTPNDKDEKEKALKKKFYEKLDNADSK